MATSFNSETQPVGNSEDAFANEQESLDQSGTKAEGKSFSEFAVLGQEFSFGFADLSLLANKGQVCRCGDEDEWRCAFAL